MPSLLAEFGIKFDVITNLDLFKCLFESSVGLLRTVDTSPFSAQIFPPSLLHIFASVDAPLATGSPLGVQEIVS